MPREFDPNFCKPGDTRRDPDTGWTEVFVEVDAQRIQDLIDGEKYMEYLARPENQPHTAPGPKYPGGPPPDWDG